MKDLKASISKAQESVKEVAAYMADSPSSDYKYEEMCYSMDCLRREISALWQNFYTYCLEHEKGHLPKVMSSEQMQRVVSVLGLDKEYQVVPKYIYASDGKVEKLVLELTPKNK